jgi:hypothetical protein
MVVNKLTTKWFEKITKGETINIADLYEFSKIKLKRSRMRKKFNKNYSRYVSNEIIETYWGICLSTPLINSFNLRNKNFNASVGQCTGELSGELCYLKTTKQAIFICA